MRRLAHYAQRFCGLGGPLQPAAFERPSETPVSGPSAVEDDDDEDYAEDIGSVIPFRAPSMTERASSEPYSVASRPTVEYHGRWTDDGFTMTAGASMHFRTSSPRVTLTFGPKSELKPERWVGLVAPTMVWSVDGEESGRIGAQAGKEIVLYDERVLDEVRRRDGEKDFVIVMADYDGKLHVKEICVAEGHPLLSPTLAAKPATNVLFIGDSLTSGFNPMFAPEALPLGTYQAYPILLTHSLRAAGHNIHSSVFAYPGIKLISIKSRYSDVVGMDQKLFKGWNHEGVNGWDDETDKPNVVFICIGTNDRGTGVDEDLYLSVFRPFIEAIREAAGTSIHHMVIISPFGSFNGGSRRSIFEPAVFALVQELEAEWEKEGHSCKIWHVDTKGWVTSKQLPDGLHPDAEGHEMIATRLEDWARETGVLGQI